MSRRDRSEPRELDLYEGRERIGTIIVRGRKYQAFGRDGVGLGEFLDQRSAARAILQGVPGSGQEPPRI
jgi:hypothetical protein